MSCDELPAWSRTYAGYRERFVLPFSLQLAEDRILNVEQRPCVSAAHARESKASADGSCTASTVWDAGVVLAMHVFAHRLPTAPVLPQSADAPSRAPRRCLDLGSGTGIVGLAAAASGSFEQVVLTDLPTVVPLLLQNIKLNEAIIAANCQVDAIECGWDSTKMLRRVARRGPFDLIVGGDLLYRPPVVEPLLNALQSLAGNETKVLLAASLQHSPETIELFAAAAEEAGFAVDRLGDTAQCAEWFSPEVKLLRLQRAKRQPVKDGKKAKRQRSAPPTSND